MVQCNVWSEIADKIRQSGKYMQGYIRYMYSSEIIIVARSLRSLVKI